MRVSVKVLNGQERSLAVSMKNTIYMCHQISTVDCLNHKVVLLYCGSIQSKGIERYRSPVTQVLTLYVV